MGILVSDVVRATDFYGEVLGLEQIERPDFGFPGAWYQLGDVQIHLLGQGSDAGATPARDGISPLGRHLALEVEDYEATLAALEARGIEVLGLGSEAGQMFVQDPDGNLVELIVPGGRLGRRSGKESTRR